MDNDQEQQPTPKQQAFRKVLNQMLQAGLFDREEKEKQEPKLEFSNPERQANYEGAIKTLSERKLPFNLQKTQEEILRNSTNNK